MIVAETRFPFSGSSITNDFPTMAGRFWFTDIYPLTSTLTALWDVVSVWLLSHRHCTHRRFHLLSEDRCTCRATSKYADIWVQLAKIFVETIAVFHPVFQHLVALSEEVPILVLDLHSSSMLAPNRRNPACCCSFLLSCIIV